MKRENDFSVVPADEISQVKIRDAQGRRISVRPVKTSWWRRLLRSMIRGR